MSLVLHFERCLAKSRRTILDGAIRRKPCIQFIKCNASNSSDSFRGTPRLATNPITEIVSTTRMCQKSRGFHYSAANMLAVRRRRRGSSRKVESSADESSEEGDAGSTLQLMHAPVTDPVEFSEAASRLLCKIERSVEPMKTRNETFITKRSDGEIGEMFTIDLGPQLGIFQIETSTDEQVFEYSSPISGKLLYCLSSATGEWINMEDGHQFEGILVRDLLRSNCIGLPDL